MRIFFKSRIIFTVVVFFNLLGVADLSFAQRTASGLVVSDSPLATKAGMEILERGGNAMDAAIATAFALSVVDQASSGLGGGGFMVIYDAKERRAHALDFRETAPEGARKELYMKDGKPVSSLSLTGGLAVAVPGEVAGLLAAFKRFGSLPLQALAAPAIKYATEGFPLEAALRFAIERQQATMRKFPDIGRVFLPKDQVPAESELIRQPELGETLKAIASQGAEVFYQGWIAQSIVDTVKKEGGVLTLEDLKNYKPVWREPLIGQYRKRTVIAMPPPSSGGVAILQMLNVLEAHQLNKLPHNEGTYLQLLAEAMKHAFADRAQYLGDPDFVKAPLAMLTSKDYAAWIRGRISPVKTQPPKFYGLVNFKAEQGGTTHFSVVDRFGNAVACTQSVNTRFGSKLLAPRTGVVMNNTMDDFAIHPSGNVYGLTGNEANALQPKKRPLSSMAPTIILQGERPEAVVGGAGGPRIISATLQTILNLIDFQMPVREAVGSPRIHHQWMPDNLIAEADIPAEAKRSLERRGHNVRERGVAGVVQAITVKQGKASGAADPRKEERARTE
ncbi:MAG: gamma-glutamyltransferase [Deltaproteobacteria bacterium]|nr:gamma-glutamyltransferase [Deltaproteobacteria bacterium]MBI2366119.1 gamma-glutamyltransferase [Deltaproteobacteria bacterium]